VPVLGAARQHDRVTGPPSGAAADERLAALSRVVGLDPPRYVRSEVAEIAGVAHERSVRWWRAMGFPEVPQDLPAFSDLDIEMVRRLAALSGSGLVEDADILRLARVLGASFSRIAEAQLAVLERVLDAVPGTEATGDRVLRPDVVALVDAPMVKMLEDTLLYVWHRHLFAALGRRLQAGLDAAELAVGFADLSGFTRLSQRVDAVRLAELVDAFEETAFDVVAGHEGRTVKLVGDEVMFVAATLPAAVTIALELAARLRAIPEMPPVHCGIAYGLVVAVGGDVFGDAVNLAARLTTAARRDTIVIPRALAGQLEGRDDVETVRIRRPVRLKGFGDTRVVSVRRRSPRD
jgi:adenylate cyclase